MAVGRACICDGPAQAAARLHPEPPRRSGAKARTELTPTDAEAELAPKPKARAGGVARGLCQRVGMLVDVCRLQRITEAGYRCRLALFDELISQHNRVIIATPTVDTS